MKQTKLRTNEIKYADNISFSIGTATAVQKYSNFLDFETLFGKYKKRGICIVGLIEALLSYRLTENQSTSKASTWINQYPVLEEFSLDNFEERTLFRVLEILGRNYEEIIFDLQDVLFSKYEFPHTDVNLDWSSIVLWGLHAPLGAYGHSRDHRPDKKQITIGIAELASPINIPIGFTVNSGNTNDQRHFKDTFNQIKHKLKDGSRIVFDKGAHSKENIDMVLASKMKYLSAKKLNRSDDKRIQSYHKETATLIDKEKGIYGTKIIYPSRIDYFYFSERLQQEQVEAKLRKVDQMYTEAKNIQYSLDKNRQLPKRFRINNPLVDVKYTYQTKLSSMGEDEARVLLKKAAITGREGFFCLVSSEDLTLEEALKIYRMKDSVEKVFQSMKNDINIKPLRVWSDNSMKGAVLIGFLAQLIISLIRYDYPDLKHLSPKFIKISLSNLTVTVENISKRLVRRIFSNFDPINELICCQNSAIS